MREAFEVTTDIIEEMRRYQQNLKKIFGDDEI
jgi:hypothetical protein